MMLDTWLLIAIKSGAVGAHVTWAIECLQVARGLQAAAGRALMLIAERKYLSRAGVLTSRLI